MAIVLIDRDSGSHYTNTPNADLYLDRQKTTYVAGLVPLAVGATPEQMIDAADKAMYARKKERRG